MSSIHALLIQGQQLLSHLENGRWEAELLLAKASGMNRASLKAHPEKILSDDIIKLYLAWCQRRAGQEPIAYILEEKEFWSLNLKVTPEVLIPRPETELLVESCLSIYQKQASLILADLGTGSGAIALALAKEKPSWSIIAIDKSYSALNLAKYNANQHEIKNVFFLQADWLQSLQPHSLDAIVANPPYIPLSDEHLQQKELSFEPLSALVAENHGLACIEKILQSARTCLKPGAQVLIEHGYDQHSAVQTLFSQYGFKELESYRDLLGWWRVTKGQFKA